MSTSGDTSATSAPLLSMRGIRKSFPGVCALDGVDLALHSGEVLALVGENGAGKSTLMKILGGVYAPDTGAIELDGGSVRLATPAAARRLGISIIHQEFNLVPALTVRENLFLGSERRLSSWLNIRSEQEEARRVLDRLGVDLDPSERVANLSTGRRQIVEIARALAHQSRIIVMDEPTAALAPNDVARLFAVVKELRSQGIGIIYISHRLDEVFTIADRIMVIRDGGHIRTALRADFSRHSIIEDMVGRSLTDEYPARDVSVGEPRLRVDGLRRGHRVRDVSLTVHRGEVLGLTGLVGAGRTEVARLIFGADRRDAGVVSLDGNLLTLRSPRDAIRAGICLLTEDRQQQGIVPTRDVLENFGLASLSRRSRCGFLDGRGERQALQRYADEMRIRMSSSRQSIATLSGGNQQKVLLARWLESNSEVILFDEPTRGIDVGARYEIYQLINRLAARGKAIIVISSEMSEVIGMCDRVLVMREGRVAGEIQDVDPSSQAMIGRLATGVVDGEGAAG